MGWFRWRQMAVLAAVIAAVTACVAEATPPVTASATTSHLADTDQTGVDVDVDVRYRCIDASALRLDLEPLVAMGGEVASIVDQLPQHWWACSTNDPAAMADLACFGTETLQLSDITTSWLGTAVFTPGTVVCAAGDPNQLNGTKRHVAAEIVTPTP